MFKLNGLKAENILIVNICWSVFEIFFILIKIQTLLHNLKCQHVLILYFCLWKKPNSSNEKKFLSVFVFFFFWKAELKAELLVR